MSINNNTEYKFLHDNYGSFAPKFNVSYILPFLSGVFVFPSAAQVQDAFSSFGKDVQKEIEDVSKEIVAVKQPIAETINYIWSSQCSNIKKLLGLEYEQVDGMKEPDLTQLTLHFRSRKLNVVYNLTSAARLLIKERRHDPMSNLIIFIHGFTDHPSNTNFETISEAFLKTGEFNILGLDASSLIKWLYMRSTTFLRFAGEELGKVLAAMVHKGLDPKSIHLIGHSLGSHIAGFTGKQFKKLTGLQVERITGLDPAGLCFSHIDPELRLIFSDAKFVDVIHTNTGVYGIAAPIGHVDFFPNGGALQPNCHLLACNHMRVNELFAESITNPKAFLAKACKDYDAFKKGQCYNDVGVMGYSCSADTRGLYFLRTGGDPPYGLGENGTRWENNESIIRNVGSGVGDVGKDIGKNIGDFF